MKIPILTMAYKISDSRWNLPSTITRSAIPRTYLKPNRISLKQLRKRLKTSESLPKYALIETNYFEIYNNRYARRDCDLDRSVLCALIEGKRTKAELATALLQANCVAERLCGRWSCCICRQVYWYSQRGHLFKIMGELDESSISHATIICSVTDMGIDSALAGILQFKEEWREVMRRFEEIRYYGHFEIDYLPPKAIMNEGRQLTTLKSLGYEPYSESGALVPHVHLIIGHANFERNVLAARLKYTFKGPYRVVVSGLRRGRPIRENLENLLRYPLKSLPPVEIMPGRGSRRKFPRDPAQLRYFDQVMTAAGAPHGLRITDSEI